MKKFIFSLVTFVSGLLGMALCLMGGSVIESTYIKSGLADSLTNYYYQLSPSAKLGTFVFTIIAIFGFIFTIINVNKIEDK